MFEKISRQVAKTLFGTFFTVLELEHILCGRTGMRRRSRNFPLSQLTLHTLHGLKIEIAMHYPRGIEPSTGNVANCSMERQAIKTAVGEPAGMGCYGVETEKMQIVSSPCIATACNKIQRSAKRAKMPQVPPRGIGTDSNE